MDIPRNKREEVSDLKNDICLAPHSQCGPLSLLAQRKWTERKGGEIATHGKGPSGSVTSDSGQARERLWEKQPESQSGD